MSDQNNSRCKEWFKKAVHKTKETVTDAGSRVGQAGLGRVGTSLYLTRAVGSLENMS